MLKRIKLDPEKLRLDMSWRLAISLATGLVLGGAGTMTWAYSYGKELIATTDAHRNTALTAYPTWPQVLQVIREERQMLNQANELRHSEVMKRLERIEDHLK
jgi:hypothetical protein